MSTFSQGEGDTVNYMLCVVAEAVSLKCLVHNLELSHHATPLKVNNL